MEADKDKVLDNILKTHFQFDPANEDKIVEGLPEWQLKSWIWEVMDHAYEAGMESQCTNDQHHTLT